MIRSSAVCALTFAALTVAAASAIAQTRVQAGILQCWGAPTASFIVGSVHELGCGFTEQSAPAWAVFAPTHRIGPGELSGNYGGVTAGGAIGIGGNASALVGGSNNELALQPLSFEGQTGLNVAVGIAGLELHYASGSLQKKGSTSQQAKREALFQQFLDWQKNQPVEHRPR